MEFSGGMHFSVYTKLFIYILILSASNSPSIPLGILMEETVLLIPLLFQCCVYTAEAKLSASLHIVEL